MRTFLKAMLTAALVAGGVALTPVAAYANHASVDCRMVTFAQEVLTGGQDTYTGIVTGYVLSNTIEPVSIQCFVEVNGGEASAIPSSNGNTTAVAAGQVTFTASASDQVVLCAAWSAGSESGVTCFPTNRRTVSYDIDSVINPLVDPVIAALAPTLCPVLISVDDIVDVRGAIDIKNDEGDVSVLNIKVFDCPPFDLAHDRFPGGTINVIYA